MTLVVERLYFTFNFIENFLGTHKLSFPSGKNKAIKHSKKQLLRWLGLHSCFVSLYFTECVGKIKWDSWHDYSTGFYNMFLKTVLLLCKGILAQRYKIYSELVSDFLTDA